MILEGKYFFNNFNMKKIIFIKPSNEIFYPLLVGWKEGGGGREGKQAAAIVIVNFRMKHASECANQNYSSLQLKIQRNFFFFFVYAHSLMYNFLSP